MKILFYNSSPIFGGHEIMTLRIIAALVKDPIYQLSFAYYAGNLQMVKELARLPDVNKVNLISSKIKSGHMQGVMSFFQWLSLYRLVKLVKNNYDLVCVAQGNIEISSLMLLAAKLAGVKVVSYIPGDFMPEELNLPFARLRKFFAARLYTMPDALISISKSFVAGLMVKSKLSQDRVFLLENIVTVSSPTLAPKLSINQPVTKLAIVGAVNKIKNQQFILDWLKQKPDFLAEVYIIGDGSLLNQLQRQVAESASVNKVRFMGWQQDCCSLMRQMDVLLIPSLIEGVPLVMLEAALLKLPILATDAYGMHDFLHPEMLFARNNATDFEEKLDALLSDHVTTARLIELNYAKVIKNNSLDNFEQSISQIFAEIILLN